MEAYITWTIRIREVTGMRSRASSGFTPIRAERGDPLIEIENLCTYYNEREFLPSTPVKAVDGVSLDIARGETFGLVGESGCGKTTLGRTLVGFESPTAGTITFDRRDVTRLDGKALTRWRRHCQMVFQDPDSSLDERMTAGELIEEPLDVHDWEDPRTRRERALGLLDRVGLESEHYYRYPHQFSGGQRQRIAIARALALEPEFLVLDEPVSALDVSVQAQILDLLADLQAEFDLTYLFVAHDLAVVRQICDRVAVMYLGNLLEVGPTDAVFEDPANPYTRALLSAIPEPDPATEWDPTTLRGDPPNPRYPPTGCPFATRCPEKLRPERFDLDEGVWETLDAFHGILRDRAHADASLSDRLRSLVGDGEDTDLRRVRADLFSGQDLPDGVRTELDAVLRAAEREGPEAALDRFIRTFGSDCDTTLPSAYPREAGQRSRCHRHDAESPSAE